MRRRTIYTRNILAGSEGSGRRSWAARCGSGYCLSEILNRKGWIIGQTRDSMHMGGGGNGGSGLLTLGSSESFKGRSRILLQFILRGYRTVNSLVWALRRVLISFYRTLNT